jgi:4-hydroxyacetophenone monooxygenase
MVIDNQWYRTLARDNVELVTDGIVEATPQGLRTRDGREHPLDVLIFATGFHNTHFLFPMKVRGRDGVSLEARFGSDEDVRAYLGVAVPGFPNLFHLMGPNSAIVGGSAVYTMECQANYIVGCVSAMIDRGLATLECREEVCQAYNAELDAKTAELVWSLPDAGSRYQNSSGRVVINHPWRLQDYWAMTRQPDLEDFHAAPLAPGPPLP